MNIRRLALNLLNEYEAGGKYVNLALASHSLDPLSREERAAITALLYTTVEHKLTYDYYISALAKRAPEKIDSYTRNILRLGLCQIVDMDSIPSFAAVNETVKLARNPGERAFVNGVLRTAAANPQTLPLPDENKNYKRYLSVKYSFPLSEVKRFDAILGREKTEELLSYYNNVKYTDITVNSFKTKTKDYKNMLAERKIEALVDSDTGISLRIPHSVNPENLPGFSEGLFFVQDKASAISSLALSARSGERIVDVCACPGGKSFAVATLASDACEVYSFDLHESKLSLIESGAARLGLSSIRVAQCDATVGNPTLFGSADKVICDVPCSGLGVLAKKPDLRYKDDEAFSALPTLQLEILTASVKYLRVGGELLYSTCTLNPAENEEVVSAFHAENPQYEVVDFKVGSYSSEGGTLTLLPHITKTDGFFIAKIRKVDNSD